MSADPQSCSSSNYPSTPPQPKVGCQASPERHAVAPLEVTVFTKDGPLTKRISLNEDSSIKSDGSACLMWHGHAGRAQLDSMQAFADLVGSLGPNQAIALGTLVPNLDDQVAVVTKRDLKGSTGPSVIARTAEHVQYRAGEPALALIDIDLKGIPESVSAKGKWHGGYRDALSAVLPGLAGAAGVLRASTSSGLRRTDTGEEIEGSGGLHWFVLVKDGADIERFLRALHDRCWLAGLGWMLVGKAGRLLERSLVDRMVYGPERLVFEGRPIVDPPLEQDQEMRRPIVVPGEMVDTRAICPDLTWDERDKLKELQEAEKKRLSKQLREARGRFIEERAGTIAERHGISHAEAKAIVGQWCDGVLLPKVELQFDDPGLAGCTVGDVLADPERFVGTTLADPLEGVEYGRGKAVVMQRRDGSLCIHSFAHGRTVYRLVEHSQAVATKGYAAREDGGLDADDLWRDELIRGKSGRPLSNFANCLIALRGAHQLRDLFAFDEMELTAVLTRPSLLGDRGVFPQPVTDDTVAGVWDWLQRNGLPSATIDAVHRAVDKVCMDRPFHPLREYLSHLVWDGVPRIDDWLGTYMGAESTPYTRVVGPKWLISGTARVMQPGCKADHVLILEGEQGLGKSTAAKVLAGGDPWFSDDLPPIGSKDCQEHLPGKWIIELSELSAVSKAETEAVKSFISRLTDKYRASYGRKQSCVPRQCVFIGSTNKNEYLRDETGNRRYWPIKCGKVDNAALDRDRDQLWAEAFVRYQKGEPWWVDENEAKEAIAAEQDQRFEEDAREEPIRSLLMGLDRVTVSDVALWALNIDLCRLGRPEQNAIKACMQRLGWEPKRTKDGRWWVPGPNWKPTGGELDSHQISPGDSTSVKPGLFLPMLEGWPVH